MSDEALLRQLAEQQRQIVEQQRQMSELLRTLVERLHPAPNVKPLQESDRKALGRLLPVAWSACGVGNFTVSDLYAWAATHPELSQAIAEVTASPKALGKLLLRASTSRAVVSGITVTRAGSESGVAVWGLGYTHEADMGAQGFKTTE